LRGVRPFRFENIWLEFEGSVVKEWWEEAQVKGFAGYVIARKLSFIKEKLKKCNRDVFGDQV